MSDPITKAKLMAKIAAPLLAASVRASDNLNGETLAQNFSEDINRVVPIAQILVETLKPQNEEERDAVNAIVAPIAAQLVAQNPDLFGEDNAEELARLLKPSLNVLASFCDRESAAKPLSELQGALPRSLVALSPIVGCLSQYAFGKSPAKRLTDTLDVWLRAQDDLLKSVPRVVQGDPDFRLAAQEAAAALFCSHFQSALSDREDGAPDTQFRTLLQQWGQSLALLEVLLKHAALEDDGAVSETNVRPLRAQTQNEGDDEGEEEQGGSSGSGGRANKAGNYNPMSFFAKKGV